MKTTRKPFAITLAADTDKVQVSGAFDAAQDLWVGSSDAVAGSTFSSWTSSSNTPQGSDSDSGSDSDYY